MIDKEQIYEEFHLKVLNYINSQINNYYLAEDLCSDVFLKVYEKIDTFDENKAKLSTWIFTITRNKLIDYYRKRKIEVEINENIAYNPIEDDDLLTDENLEKLACALEKLDSRDRQIIIKHYYSHISLKDIASELGISYVYVKVLHKNALLKLKNSI